MKPSIKDQAPPEGFVLVKEGSLQAMAENIDTVAKSIRRLEGPGKLNRRSLVLLIREGTRAYGPVVEERDVNSVLTSMANLDAKFLTPSKTKRSRS